MDLREFHEPLVMLSALPWILLFAWIAARLLGTRHLSRRRIAVAGIAGYVAALAATFVLVERGTSVAGSAWPGAALAVVFTMAAVVALELLSGRPVPTLAPRPPRLPHPVSAVRRRVRETARFAEVSTILVRAGVGHLFGLDRDGARADRADDVARRVRGALEDAGGIFIKIGQLLATRVDLIPPDAAREFARLQERAPAVDAGRIREALESELGRPVEEVFVRFDWEPLAAASIAQVHRALLPGDEPVVVKVRRPGIAGVVERDLAIVRRLVHRIERRTAWGSHHGAGALADEFAERLREELDLTNEARNIADVTAALADQPDVRLPQVHAELSTVGVLVMEELPGVSISALADPADIAVDRRKAAELLLRAELEPMLEGALFHADPHPGNVFILPDGGIGLIDLGATGRLDAFERASISGLITAIRDQDPTLLREAIAQVATLGSGVDVAVLDRALARFMATHLSSGTTPDVTMLTDLTRLLADHRIQLPQATTTMFRALVTVEGTLQVLDPEFRLLEAAEQLGSGLMVDRLRPESLQTMLRDEAVRVAPLLRDAPRHLDRIARLVERGDLHAHISLFSTDRDAELVTRLVNRAILGFAGATLGIVSAILLAIDAGPQITATTTLLDVLGYAGLFAGMVLLLRVVLSAVRETR